MTKNGEDRKGENVNIKKKCKSGVYRLKTVC